jgi:hypothetical protein
MIGNSFGNGDGIGVAVLVLQEEIKSIEVSKHDFNRGFFFIEGYSWQAK